MKITKQQLKQIIKEEISGAKKEIGHTMESFLPPDSAEKKPEGQPTAEVDPKLKEKLQSSWKYMQIDLIGSESNEPGSRGLFNEWKNARGMWNAPRWQDISMRYGTPINDTRSVLKVLNDLREMSPAAAQAEQDLVKIYNGMKEMESKLVQLMKSRDEQWKVTEAEVERSKSLMSQAHSDLRPLFDRAFTVLVKGGLMTPQGQMARSGN